MKKYLLLLILLSLTAFIFAQDQKELKQSLRFGVNGAFWGSGDVIGKSIYGEYVFPINQFLSIVPRVMTGSANDEHQTQFNDEIITDYDIANSFATSISASITPFQKSLHNFSFDIGLVYHKWAKSSGYNKSWTPNRTVLESNYYEDNSIGFLGSLRFKIIDTSTIESGIRADMITGFYGSYLECLSLQAGFYIGVKL